jgi:hypothetical protein
MPSISKSANLGAVQFKEQGSAPSAPPSGYVQVYAKADGKLYAKDDAGAEYDLTAAGGAPLNASYLVEDANGTLTAEVLTSTLIAAGIQASLPVAAKSGRLYWPTNSVYLFRDSGAAQVAFGPIWKLTRPVDGQFSWVNQGSSSVSDANGGLYLTASAGASPNLRCRVKAQPSKPYKIGARFALHSRTVGAQFGGMLWRDSVGGGLVAAYINNNATLVVAKYSSPTALSANYTSVALTNFVVNGVFFMQIEDDSTNRIVSISPDGYNWMQVHSVGNTDFITADQVGFFASPATGAIPSALWLHHWEES